MPDELVRKNVCIHGHRTSLRLESEILDAIDEICQLEDVTVHELCTLIELRRTGANWTSALRAFIVSYFREAATSDGHIKAGHDYMSKEIAIPSQPPTPQTAAGIPARPPVVDTL
jgi:predicted DNA-binding ribbon-helix-helix protein